MKLPESPPENEMPIHKIPYQDMELLASSLDIPENSEESWRRILADLEQSGWDFRKASGEYPQALETLAKKALEDGDNQKIGRLLEVFGEDISRYLNPSGLKERKVVSPELLPEKEASKTLLAEERQRLAKEIREGRSRSRDKIAELKVRENLFQTMLETNQMNLEQIGADYAMLCTMRAQEANSLAGRIRGLLQRSGVVSSDQEEETITTVEIELAELDREREEIEQEINNIRQLIEADEGMKRIESSIAEHYAKADNVAKKHFDEQQRSAEQTTLRNNIFLVHKIEERNQLRHNINSNVSEETTYEDDIDILLSLEPSVSASSVKPGEKADLWPGASGFLIGGGRIPEAAQSDKGTRAIGIKQRTSAIRVRERNDPIESIDEVAGRKRMGGGMNELVVDNPEMFGFFQNAEMDEDGNYWAYERGIKDLSARAKNDTYDRESLERNIAKYRHRFDVARDRGMPLFIMMPDRRVFECFGVNDDGTLVVGREVAPQEVATGRAGISAEKRKIIGERLLQKNLFKNAETQQEAKDIVKNLGQNPGFPLSRE